MATATTTNQFSLSKGSRVEWKDKEGIMHYGIIKAIRQGKMTVIEDGGKMQWSGSGFRPSYHPMPQEAVKTPMDAYEVRNYKKSSLGHGDSELFQAKIFKNGRHILNASNDGFGGCNCYYAAKGIPYTEYHEIEMQLFKDVKEWATLNGMDDLHEAADIWITWYVYDRPFGMTAKQYFDDWKEERKKWEA